MRMNIDHVIRERPNLTSGLLIPMPKATVAQTILILSSIHSRCTCRLTSRIAGHTSQVTGQMSQAFKHYKTQSTRPTSPGCAWRCPGPHDMPWHLTRSCSARVTRHINGDAKGVCSRFPQSLCHFIAIFLRKTIDDSANILPVLAPDSNTKTSKTAWASWQLSKENNSKAAKHTTNTRHQTCTKNVLALSQPQSA